MNKSLMIGLVLLPLACSSKGATSDGGTTGIGGVNGNGGTTGSAGSTGSGGTRSSGGTTGSGGTTCSGSVPAADTSQAVLERNKHASRDGNFVQPGLTKAKAGTMTADAAFVPNLNVSTVAGGNNVWASPLYLPNGPNGKGVFFEVTTGNDVYALDETTGARVWTHNIGSSPTANGVSCGNIHPLGILSTPVIDATSRTIYVAGAIGTTAISDHQVHALSVDDGTEKSGWPASVLKAKSGSLAFMPPPQNQRSALSLVGGKVYVAYGGHVGDCGPYHGWVVGIDTQDPTMMGAWASGGQGEGIWGAAGMASDGTGVFALTGNSTAGVTTHLDSEEAVRITGLGTLADSFYASTWKTMDIADADLGASNPVYFELPCATPSKILAVVSKDGHLYLLDAGHLGGMGGQKVDLMVATGAMSIHTAVASYTTAKGRYLTFGTDSGAVCPSGGGGKSIVSVRIPPGAPPAPKVAWCAPLGGSTTGPISTTTDGTNEVVVWYMNNGKLSGVDGDTGAAIFTSTNTCSGVRQWTSPIAVNGRIVTTGDGHLCSWSAP